MVTYKEDDAQLLKFIDMSRRTVTKDMSLVSCDHIAQLNSIGAAGLINSIKTNCVPVEFSMRTLNVSKRVGQILSFKL